MRVPLTVNDTLSLTRLEVRLLAYVAGQKLTANFHCRTVSSISLLGEPLRTASKATTGIRPFVWTGEALANKLLFGVFGAQDEDAFAI